MENIAFPDHYMPFRERRSPHEHSARRHTDTWAEETGMFDPEVERASHGKWSRAKYDAADFPKFTAWTYPDADESDLHLLSDWMVFTWFCDDMFEAAYHDDPHDYAARVERQMAFMPVHLTPPPAPRTLAERAAHDLWIRTAPRMTPAWRERYTGSFRAFLHGCRWAETLADRSPDFVDYLEPRRDFGAAINSIFLIEFAQRYEIPDVLRRSRPFRALLASLCDATDLHNDIVSLPKETALAEEHANGVTVLRRIEAGTLQEAVDGVDRILTSRVRTLEELPRTDLALLLDDLRADPATRDQTARFVAALQTMLAGMYAWTKNNPRYATRPTAHPFSPPAATGLGTHAARWPHR